jgi:alkane 1-monooxygenase
MGMGILVMSMYPHFYVEHIKGHHKRVATEEDPASARMNESFYTFWGRSVVGGLLSALRIDWKTTASLWACSLMLCGAAYGLLGLEALKFLVLQGVVAFTLLELVNYIEHYGLSRNSSEQVTPFHSWNAGHRVTNYFLFKLQRHSDHHAYSWRRYQILRSWKHSPQLPTGYAGMVLCALVPPLFFAVMNPLVRKAREDADRWKKSGINPFTDEYAAAEAAGKAHGL